MCVRVVRAGQAQAVDLHELEGGQLLSLSPAPGAAHELHHRGRLAGAGHPGDVQAPPQGRVTRTYDSRALRLLGFSRALRVSSITVAVVPVQGTPEMYTPQARITRICDSRV